MKYRDRNDKSFLLDLVYDWRYDDDTEMMVSDGFSTEFVHICALIVIAVLAFICF